MRGWKKVLHANGNKNKAGVAILISGKIDFKIKTVIRDKEGHYIMIKGSSQEEDITILYVCCGKHRSTSIYKEILTVIKGEIVSNTIVVGDFKPHFYQWRDHQDRKSKSKHKP